MRNVPQAEAIGFDQLMAAVSPDNSLASPEYVAGLVQTFLVGHARALLTYTPESDWESMKQDTLKAITKLANELLGKGDSVPQAWNTDGSMAAYVHGVLVAGGVAMPPLGDPQEVIENALASAIQETRAAVDEFVTGEVTAEDLRDSIAGLAGDYTAAFMGMPPPNGESDEVEASAPEGA